MAGIDEVHHCAVLNTAIVRAILAVTHETDVGKEATDPNKAGHLTSTLRYKLTLKNRKVTKAKLIPHYAEVEGYEDDDDNYGIPRLLFLVEGEVAKARLEFEQLLHTWFEEDMFGCQPTDKTSDQLKKKIEHFKITKEEQELTKTGYKRINDVLEKLIPQDILKTLTSLSMKVDIYTDRLNLAWHKDWDTGHALVVGLLNVSANALSSTELVLLPDDNSEQKLIDERTIRTASKTRTSMRGRIPQALHGKPKKFVTTKPQSSGEMVWFNDVVWVHRTPPMGAFKNANSTYFTIGSGKSQSPDFVNIVKEGQQEKTYAEKDTGARELLRVTIRDVFEPTGESLKALVQYNRRTMKFVFLAPLLAAPNRWRVSKLTSSDSEEFVPEHLRTRMDPTGHRWRLQSAGFPKNFKYGRCVFEYQDNKNKWRAVAAIDVPVAVPSVWYERGSKTLYFQAPESECIQWRQTANGEIIAFNPKDDVVSLDAQRDRWLTRLWEVGELEAGDYVFGYNDSQGKWREVELKVS